MTDTTAYVLKILTGVQAGAEVSLAEAEYVLGAGPDDDLHFVDVSLKPGHARLQLEDGAIKVAGGAGTVKTRSGLSILAGDETWQEIEALDVITIGTTSFAIGQPTADWSKIHSFSQGIETKKPISPPPVVTQSKWGRGDIVKIAVGIVVLFFIFSWLADGSTRTAGTAASADDRPDLEIVTTALNAFPFAENIAVRQEVDGVIEAAGYVDTPVERRALRNAVEDTAIPVRFRVWSRAVIENETQAIIENQQMPVQFSVGDDGVLTLRGDVLDEARVDGLVAAITQNVAGIAEVDVQVQTARAYLEQIQELLARSELDDSVILRLNGMLIEANGVVVANKVDNWVGFIQSYARRYADVIPLRSFVQLVDETGQVIADPVLAQPNTPVVVGAVSSLAIGDGVLPVLNASTDGETAQSDEIGTGTTGVVLNLERLKEGSFGPEDVFQGFTNGAPDQNTGQSTDQNTDQITGQQAALDVGQTTIAVQPSPIRSQFLSRAARPESIRGARVLHNMTKAVLSGDFARQETPGDMALLGDINATLDQMKHLWGSSLNGQAAQNAYINMLINAPTDFNECWDNSIAAIGNLPNTLFWLDYLSVTDEVDVSIINSDAQVLLLEAALNPTRLAACAARIQTAQGIDLSELSLYLQESQLNPEFIRFIVRRLEAYPFALSGVNTGFQNRYAQLTNGARYNEGASPDPSSLLLNVGELGLLVKENDRLLVKIYDASLHWKSGG